MARAAFDGNGRQECNFVGCVIAVGFTACCIAVALQTSVDGIRHDLIAAQEANARSNFRYGQGAAAVENLKTAQRLSMARTNDEIEAIMLDFARRPEESWLSNQQRVAGSALERVEMPPS